MSSFLRRPRQGLARDTVPESTAALAVTLPEDGAAPVGTCPIVGGDLISASHYELHATGVGLIVAPQTGGTVPVPALVPWSEVCSVNARGVTDGADGSCGEVLEIEVTDGGWFIGARVQRFVAPPSSLEPFVLAASSRRTLTVADPGGAHHGPGPLAAMAAMGAGVAAGLRSLRSRWTGAQPEDSTGPRHGLGRRRIGPIAVGAMALVLLAGSTSTTFGSLAGGAARGLSSRDLMNGSGNSLQALREGQSSHLLSLIHI